MYTPNVGGGEERVRAIASWSAQNDWQLSFDVGQLIIVTDKFESKSEYEGWNQGKLGDEVGLFPVSYTEPYKQKEFSVNEKKISQLVANLQKQCGFLKSEGIADLKKEFNDLQKELANSPTKQKPRHDTTTPPPLHSTVNINVNSATTIHTSTGTQDTAESTHKDNHSDNITDSLKKELEQLRKKYKSECSAWEQDRKNIDRLEEELKNSRSETTEQLKYLSDSLKKKDFDILRIMESRDKQNEQLNKSELVRKSLEEKVKNLKEIKSKRVVELENRLKEVMEQGVTSKEESTRLEALRKTMEESEEKYRAERKSLKSEIQNLQQQLDTTRQQLAQKQTVEHSQAARSETEEIESLKKQLEYRTKELEIAKLLIEQTAQITLKKQQQQLPTGQNLDDQTVENLKEELEYSQQNVATLYAMLEDERRSHQMLIDEIAQKPNKAAQQTKSKWGPIKKGSSSVKITKAPSAPQYAIKIAELQSQIEEFSEIIDILVEDKHQLVEMNTQLLSQIRSFLSNPPTQFLEFHMKEHVEKNKILSQELSSVKIHNENNQKKITELQKKIKDLEKSVVKQKFKTDLPKQEETDPNYEEHVIDSQTNVLLQQLKDLQSAAVALGVNPKMKSEVKVITTEAKLTHQLELIKQKLSDSRSRELDLELELISSKEELQKYKLAIDIGNMIT